MLSESRCFAAQRGRSFAGAQDDKSRDSRGQVGTFSLAGNGIVEHFAAYVGEILR